MDDFLFEIVDLSSTIDTGKWARFYDEIPVDPYVDEGYRYKAVAWLRVKHACAAVNAAIDRLVHHSVILEFDVPSFRTEDAKTKDQKEKEVKNGAKKSASR
jgi:hypothetical protein